MKTVYAIATACIMACFAFPAHADTCEAIKRDFQSREWIVVTAPDITVTYTDTTRTLSRGQESVKQYYDVVSVSLKDANGSLQPACMYTLTSVQGKCRGTVRNWFILRSGPTYAMKDRLDDGAGRIWNAGMNDIESRPDCYKHNSVMVPKP